MTDLIRRQAALDKTMHKYRKRPFDWAATDCIRMARSHLVAMGHKPPKLPRYTNAAGALRALRSTGHQTIEQLLDSLLVRIPPARMLPGDLALIPPPEGAVLEAVAISTGYKLFGFHEDAEEGAVVITPGCAPIAAYRL